MVPDEGILPSYEALRDEVGELEPVDAHTHLGSNDPDGYRCAPAELIDALARIDGRGIVFPLHEPEGYRAANDMVREAADASEGRLLPFCRVDPHGDAVGEAERSLEAGALGIKLHPRAEGFTLDHPGLRPLFALAGERRLPILCHAGRGIPALGRHAVEACRSHPGMRLILAHAGISDLAWIWRDARELPNLYFDTAWWSPSDLQALLALVPPGQVLMASDAPYGNPAWGAVITLRHALQLGLGPAQARGIVGAQAARLVAAEEPLDLGPPPGAEAIVRDPLLERVYTALIAALGQMFNGVEPAETLALARLACDVGADAPQAQVCARVLQLLDERADYSPDGDGRPTHFAPGLQFVIMAATVACTPDVVLP